MAKKRKSKTDDEGEIGFKAPKFDEVKWLKKERRNVKTLFISFILGFVIAIISFGFWTLLTDSVFRWELILLLGVFNASWLKYIFIRRNIDLEDFGRKGWFGSYAIYFFTWLLVLIILVNPPFYDDANPSVTVVALPDMQELGGTVKVLARMTDNVGIDEEDIMFSLIYPDGSNHTPTFTFENTIFSYEYDNPTNLMGEYQYTLSVTDGSGLKTIKKGSFTYDNSTIKLALPINAESSPGAEVTYASPVKFDVKADVNRMYYRVDNSTDINATEDNDGFYETTPQIKGWVRNQNSTVKAYGEVIYYFKNLKQEFNNTIVDNTVYYFKVSDVPEIGLEDSPKITPPRPVMVQVPGFGLIVFIASLLIAGLIVKYRKKE